MAQAPRRLRPGGRILLNFGTSGDFEYHRELIAAGGRAAEFERYGEATQAGLTAEYFGIRLRLGPSSAASPG